MSEDLRLLSNESPLDMAKGLREIALDPNSSSFRELNLEVRMLLLWILELDPMSSSSRAESRELRRTVDDEKLLPPSSPYEVVRIMRRVDDRLLLLVMSESISDELRAEVRLDLSSDSPSLYFEDLYDDLENDIFNAYLSGRSSDPSQSSTFDKPRARTGRPGGRFACSSAGVFSSGREDGGRT